MNQYNVAFAGHVVPSPSSTMSPEVTLTRDRVLSLFESNPVRRLRVLDVNLTLASITVANTLLEVNLIPYSFVVKTQGDFRLCDSIRRILTNKQLPCLSKL